MGYYSRESGTFVRGFDYNAEITSPSFEEITEKIEEKKNEFGSQLYINEILEIIEKNPFNEGTIDFLLNEGWTCNIDSKNSDCNYKNKLIRLENGLVLLRKHHDFYARDLTLMHELNHAWYHRFKLWGQPCLHDAVLSTCEFENRLVNEYLSRKNRANQKILKSAVEGFGLRPQIYDLVSNLAFKDNPQAELSPLAKKEKAILEVTLIDGWSEPYLGPLFD